MPYSHTALGSVEISDSLTGISAEYYLPADVAIAAQSFPVFRFDPVRDQEFYNSRSWWQQPHDAYVSGAQKVLKRFNNWYPQVPSMERVFLAVCALTDSSEQMDNIINDAVDFLKNTFRIELLDADDTIFTIPDYYAMHKETHIDEALFTPKIEWWSRLFEEQCRRVVAAPTIPFDAFKIWNTHRLDQERLIERQLLHEVPHNAGARQARRLFNRQANLFTKFFGETMTRKFVHGKNLWIRGKRFVWKLKVIPRDLMRYTTNPPVGHTPFQISICDQNLNRLADACVLFENTPILDQAIAIKIWVDDDETTLLNKTNVFSFTDAGRNDEVLTALPGAKIALATTPWLDDPGFQQVRPLDDPSIDDGFDSDANLNIEIDHYRLDRELRPEQEWPDFVVDPDDPYENAFQSEELDSILDVLLTVGSRNVDTERRAEIVGMYSRWMVQAKYERRIQAMNPIARRMREKLLSKLDVDPDILHYMQFPEFHWRYMRKVKSAPRLERFVSLKSALGR